jgi:mono/diheme cytochrome c family protein
VKHLSFAALFAEFVFLFFAITIPPAVISQKSPHSIANGRRIFNRSCAACHNTLSTTTKAGPALKGYYRRQPRPSDVSVRAVIQEGKGRMPAFSTLKKLEIDDIVAFLKTL